jgi:hypothetical protein
LLTSVHHISKASSPILNYCDMCPTVCEVGSFSLTMERETLN